MQLTMVYGNMAMGNPREFVFKKLNQGRDFGINNNPIFVHCHFEKLLRNHGEKLAKGIGISH